MGGPYPRVPHPLQAGIKAHALCGENTHLRHIQRFEPSVTEYYNFVCEPGLPVFPLPGGPAFLLPVPRPDALSPLLAYPLLSRSDLPYTQQALVLWQGYVQQPGRSRGSPPL
jgi:hypothetical protein